MSISRCTALSLLVCFLVSVLLSFINQKRVHCAPTRREDPYLQWLKLIQRDSEVVLLYTSDDYAAMAYNCYLSLIKLNVTNVGILVTSSSLQQTLARLSAPAFFVNDAQVPADIKLEHRFENVNLSRVRMDWSNRWNANTTIRWSHWMMRHYLTLQALRIGIGVLQTDVDVVYVQNPYTWINPLKYDLEGQTQDWPEPRSFNFGIGHVSASFGGLLHWETTNWMMRYTGDDPQSLEDLFLLKKLQNTVGTWTSEECMNSSSMVCSVLRTPILSARKWSTSLLPHAFEMSSSQLQFLTMPSKEQPLFGVHVHVQVPSPAAGKQEAYQKWTRQYGLWHLGTGQYEALTNQRTL